MAGKESTGPGKAAEDATPKAEAAKAETAKAETHQAETPTIEVPKIKAGAPGTSGGAAPAQATPRPAEKKAAGPGDGVADAMARWQNEPLRFLSQRLDRQIDHMGALLACRSPGELFELETRFTMQAMQDYLDETHRLFEHATEFGSGFISAWQESGPPRA
jgi:hypothetical protein